MACGWFWYSAKNYRIRQLGLTPIQKKLRGSTSALLPCEVMPWNISSVFSGLVEVPDLVECFQFGESVGQLFAPLTYPGFGRKSQAAGT